MSNEQTIQGVESSDCVSVRGGFLKAALKLAGVRDIRYYLNYIHIVRGSFGTLLVVTDGHRMGLAQLSDAPAPDGKYFFPRQPIASSIIAKHEHYDIVFESEDSAFIHTEYCDIRCTKDALPFPDWTRVVPSQIDMEKSVRNQQYNTEYVNDARLFIAEYLGAKKSFAAVSVISGDAVGNSGVMVPAESTHNEKTMSVFVVLMPLRYENTQTGKWTAPAWAKAGAEAPKPNAESNEQ